VTDPLGSAKVKLARANLHKGIAGREAGRFFNRHTAPTFRVEPEGDERPPYAIGAVVACRMVVDTAPPDLPASFAARFGDAIHNYRCALDHVAWQLVLHGSRRPLPEKERFWVQFPIYETEAGFRSNVARRLPGVDSAAVRFIKARHRYVRGNATNDALLGLARLSNDDKHRDLHIFLNLFGTLESHVTFTHAEPVSWENPPIRPAIQPGAVVTHFSYRITGSDPKVKMNLQPTAQVVIEDGRDFSEMLEGIRREVTEILNAPQILAAVT
jgi:hypothetical protein